MREEEKTGKRKNRLSTIALLGMLIAICLTSVVYAESCLTDGYVFNSDISQVPLGTLVEVTNLNTGQFITTTTGTGFPPVPPFFEFQNQYKAAFDCAQGIDTVYVYAENATHYGEDSEVVPSGGQAFINITLTDLKVPLYLDIKPTSAFVAFNSTNIFNITITNGQGSTDSFTISVVNNTDQADLNQTTITNLGAGANQTVTLTTREYWPGNYTVNVTVTSTTTPGFTKTYNIDYIVSHVPTLENLTVVPWNVTDPTMPDFEHYLNFTGIAKDLDGARDTSQILICADDIPPTNGSCSSEENTLCKFLNAPVTASATGTKVECVHATNETIKLFSAYACDSLGQCIPPQQGFWCAEDCNLTVSLNVSNKTFDNSPSFSLDVKLNNNVSIGAYCYYKTDYSPSDFVKISNTPESHYDVTMPEQNWSYRPTNLGRYPQIQHHDYYNGVHNLTISCNNSGLDGENSSIFKIEYTQRDRVYYQDGDTIKLYLRLEETGLNISANFSQIDSGFTGNNYAVNNTGLDYNITYNISVGNTRPDGQYNVTIEAFNSSGYETMNGSIFVHLHNDWQRSDIDNAFDCWSFKQGYYFDEVACDWESDLNHVADLVDVFTVEVSCFDGIDNDLDGKADIDDTDCAGQYYSLRRNLGIDSAFLGDPCFNNVCRVCVGGTDSNEDGICDSSNPDGVNVRYLQKVRPGQHFRIKFLKDSGVYNRPVRLSVNYLNQTFNISDSVSWIQQLPVKELGGCNGGDECRSVTATTFNPPNADVFNETTLAEKITMRLSSNSALGNHTYLAAGKSIDSVAAFQNLIFFQVNASAIINETDNATYCFDSEDNDLNDYYDCLDPSCDLTVNPANPGQRCEYGTELTCDDGFDNDGDGYVDCQDNDCFQKNGTTGPCYSVENFNTTSCSNKVNDDFDWGIFANSTVSRSYQDRQGGDTQLTDCLDIDCDGELGEQSLNADCEYAKEITCNDNFDNDADGRYDCTGNAYQTSYERDCDRWNNPLGSGPLYPCPRTEQICDDNIDNDLDSDYPSGATDPYLGIGIGTGGWDCRDSDCDGKKGDPLSSALCEFRNETSCDDGFDNDGDNLIDCFDPGTCTNQSGILVNLTGLCRPCPEWENITIDSCRDGTDTDANGLTDCADPDCTGLPGPGRSYCGLTENCTDGIDNDYDGDIDSDDSECVVSATYSEMCGDGKDNDGDGDIDCSDSDCFSNMRCVIGSYNNPCSTIGYVGAIQVCRYRFVKRGDNSTFRYYLNGLSASSVVLKAGNVGNSLRNISPILNDSTSFMTGTTTGFIFINDTYGLKAQADSGFTGNLNLELISETGSNVVPGWFNIFTSTSIPGVYGTKNADIYIAENEPPTINNYSVDIGEEIVHQSDVYVTIKVNGSDEGTYTSGISWCEFNISDKYYNKTDCEYKINLTPGNYSYYARAYDGSLLTSNWTQINFTVEDTPLQEGYFYNPYPAENYPDRKHFWPDNASDQVNIGVNFNGGAGFTDNTTGCVVTIINKTDTVSTQYISLNASAIPGRAVCKGQLNLTEIDPTGNASAVRGVFHFWVDVIDTAGTKISSDTQTINVCRWKYYNKTGSYVCMDPCDEKALANTPPILILNISNQTWPRGTKLTVIDLDDHFYDPDSDPLTYTWDISTDRINVTVDPKTHFVTFDPQTTFSGIATITFYAFDGFEYTPSNEVELEVKYRQLIIPIIPAGGGGGGGGEQNITPKCEEYWKCSQWGICFPNGVKTRMCRDFNECGTQLNKPETSQSCNYIPTCRDRIKNQGEESVDCGGPCPPCPSCNDNIQNRDEIGIDCGGVFCTACPTCNDNIQNQGETGIDCGGPCESCSSCTDGIKNQGELNVDCGGPCLPCHVKVLATVINWNALMLAMTLAVLGVLMFAVVLTRLTRKKYLRLKAKSLNYYMRVRRMFEKKKTVEREVPILHWGNSHLERIGKEISTKGTDAAVDDIDKLVRTFFKRVFFIRHSFSDEDLIKELKKHKVDETLQKATSILLEELAQIKYAGEELSKEEAKTLMNQVKVITESIVSHVEKEKKTKISISESDITKIDKTLHGAKKLSLKKLFGKK